MITLPSAGVIRIKSISGKIVAIGTPQEIAANKDSLTGQCLKAYIAGINIF